MNKNIVVAGIVVVVLIIGAGLYGASLGGSSNSSSASTLSSTSSASVAQNTSSSATASASTPSTSTTSSTSLTAFILPLSCHSAGGLPDLACTPGATNPDVTQANIQSTICVSGYTDTIRPSTSYTDPLKKTSIQLYGYVDTNMSDYEEDHLIPLEVGGNPTSVMNLWAEPHYGQYTSLNKDQLENSLHAQVCSGQITLAAAQQAFATNWVQAWLSSGGVASSSNSSSSTVQSSSVQLAATFSYAKNPIVRGNTQTITITLTNKTGPVVGHSLAVHVTYASLQTTKDLTCVTETDGACSVSWQIGATSNPGTFTVSVTDSVSGATFASSFQVTTA